jgi:RHS repeat-associated protein
MPGGVVSIWKRDGYGRPKEREVLAGAFAGRNAREVSRVGYEWRRPDEIAALVDATAGTTRFEHDPRGHLIAAIFPNGEVQHRASDPAGNLFQAPERSDRRYGRGGRLERAAGAEYRYDEHGNLVQKVLADGGSWKYLWTVSGRLAEVVRPDGRRVTFAYDALGRRVRKEFDGKITEFVWDGDDLVHERVSDAATGKLHPLVTWLFEPGTFAPVARFEGQKRYSVVTDVLGTPAMLMTEAGGLAWKAQLDLYGVPREETAGIEDGDRTNNPLRYPGQYHDEETGLSYNRFRYYDPETGRYISEDPIGLRGGTNLYGYVHRPLTWGDPFGLKECNIDPERVKQLKKIKPTDPDINWHMHHIVMEGAYTHWGEEGRQALDRARDVLEKVGYDMQSGNNVVWAPNEAHSVEYAKEVAEALEKIKNPTWKKVDNALKRFAAERGWEG